MNFIVSRCSCYITGLFLPVATKLGQGNIFTSVCLSTGGEGCLPQCMLGYTPSQSRPPQEHTPPPEWTPPPPQEQTPPRADTPPEADSPPQSRHPSSSRHPQGADTLPRSRHTPGKQTPAYGHRAAGTHPTGMHSCFPLFGLYHLFNIKEYNRIFVDSSSVHLSPIQSKITSFCAKR